MLKQNKLECLSLTSIFLASLISVGKAWSESTVLHKHLIGLNFQIIDQTVWLILKQKLRLLQNKIERSSLPHFKVSVMTENKSFIADNLYQCYIKLIFCWKIS